MAYDPVSDEIIVPQFYAQAIMTYRGGASGDEAPIRGINGPDTQLKLPHKLDVDPIHREIFVATLDRVLVFSSDANGNVAPIRVLQGPDTRVATAGSLPPPVAVDPVHDLLIVAADRGQLLIFNRTDSGNVKPRAVISGPKTQISSRIHTITTYPPRELFLAVVSDSDRLSPADFVSVWSIHDNGDAAPRWTVGGPNGMLRDAQGLAIDPKSKSVFVTDKYLNAVLTYYFPEIF